MSLFTFKGACPVAVWAACRQAECMVVSAGMQSGQHCSKGRRMSSPTGGNQAPGVAIALILLSSLFHHGSISHTAREHKYQLKLPPWTPARLLAPHHLHRNWLPSAASPGGSAVCQLQVGCCVGPTCPRQSRHQSTDH